MYKQETIPEGEVGLLYTRGRFEKTLAPGTYTLPTWQLFGGPQKVVRVDTRRTALTLPGQEILTTDGFTVRLSVAVDYRVVDAPRAVHTVQNYTLALYTAIQILLRDEIQTRTLDTVLADRNTIGDTLLARGRNEAEELGLELIRVGVKDITLSAEVKKLLAQEAEETRKGRAALVAAREEVATTRAKANTAKLLAENPVLLRLREWEALATVGQGYGNTVVLAVPQEILSLIPKTEE